MTIIRVWLAGKKTYLLAGGLLTVGVGLLATGRLTPSAALGIGLMATCGFPATFRSALQRHRQEELAILVSIAETGAAVYARNFPAAQESAESLAKLASALYPELKAECSENTQEKQG